MSKLNVLIGCTGSVAAIKVEPLIEQLMKTDVVGEVRLVVTENALHFMDAATLPCRVYTDKDEWDNWKKLPDPVIHIELRRWADLIVIAPLDANTLAKLANGICDNLLTCVVRAWDFTRPIVVCPAMNTLMWDHPFTERHLDALRQLGVRQLGPISKVLACQDTGMGAMSEVEDIVKEVLDLLKMKKSSNGKFREMLI